MMLAIMLVAGLAARVWAQDSSIQHEEVRLDLLNVTASADLNNLVSTANGLRVRVAAQDGVWRSRVMSVPIVSAEPFLAVTAAWRVEGQESARVSVDLRSSQDGIAWSEWQTIPLDPDSSTPALESVGGLSLLPKETAWVQFRVTLSGQRTNEPTLASFKGIFISPGERRSVDPESSLTPVTSLVVAKPPVISRSGWGCSDGQGSPLWTAQYTTVTHLIVHHTVDANSSTNWPAVVRSIFSLHRNTNRWGDIGYNYLVDPNGVVYEGRAGGDNVIGAHFSCANSSTMGVAFLGTFTSTQPNQAAWNAARQLLAWKVQQRGLDPLGSAFHPSTNLVLHTISGHRDANGATAPTACDKGTACPGNALYPLLPVMRNDVANSIRGDGAAAVSHGVTVTPAPVVVGQPFAASLTLQETNGSSIGFEQVAIAILNPDGTFRFDMQMFNNVTVPANGTWSGNGQAVLSAGAPAGLYRAVARGRVPGGNWFDFQATGGGVNPAQFQVVAPTQSYTLAVAASPSAGGTVGGGGTFAAGSSRTVSASPNSGYTFANWTENGAAVSPSASYTFTLTGNRTLVANFTSFALNDLFANAQSVNGTAGGFGGSNVGATKEAGEPNHADNHGGTSVWFRWQPAASGTATLNTVGSDFDTLLAVYTGSSVNALTPVVSNDDSANTPQSAVSFAAMAGTTYRVAVDGFNGASGAVSLNWSLDALNYAITVSASPAAGGSVSGAGTFAAGSSRTVTATANSGYTFVNWSESGSGVSSSASYTFTLNAARNLVATFTLQPLTLSVSKAGTGAGSVTSSPAGINCGSTCGAPFSSGQVVTLSPSPAPGSIFGGWSGDADCGDGVVTMSAARSCTATFTQVPNSAPFGAIDGPSAGAAVSNLVGVAGWVLDREDSALVVELLVDGQSTGSAPARGPRPDVCNAFPTIPHCTTSQPGAGFIWDSKSVADGAHTVAFRATDPGGRSTVIDQRMVTVRNKATSDALRLSDADGDGKADLTVYRPAGGLWFTLNSSTTYNTNRVTQWGLEGDIPVPGDYDGDGKADRAVYRPASGLWFLLRSSSQDATFFTVQWGLSTDTPVPGDYDGDGKTDLAVFRPVTGMWYVLTSSSGYSTFRTVQWGLTGDRPVASDYDGDGKTDFAIYRPATGMWYVLRSSSNDTAWTATQWGLATDVPAPGDYDGDGKGDLAVFRPATGEWYLRFSSTSFATSQVAQWGLPGDAVVRSDYDGDGKTDLAVYRPITGTWYVLTSSSGLTSFFTRQWGLPVDVPIPRR